MPTQGGKLPNFKSSKYSIAMFVEFNILYKNSQTTLLHLKPNTQAKIHECWYIRL